MDFRCPSGMRKGRKDILTFCGLVNLNQRTLFQLLEARTVGQTLGSHKDRDHGLKMN